MGLLQSMHCIATQHLASSPGERGSPTPALPLMVAMFIYQFSLLLLPNCHMVLRGSPLDKPEAHMMSWLANSLLRVKPQHLQLGVPSTFLVKHSPLTMDLSPQGS